MLARRILLDLYPVCREDTSMRQITLIAHNIRSCHNVGSLLRTADGLGVKTVVFTGYTPYPLADGDPRMPHIARKIDAQIHKTALGAEHMVDWRQADSIETVMQTLREDGYVIAGLEQDKRSHRLPGYKPPEKIALIVGREVEGIEPEVLEQCDAILEIPMVGRKESFNVASAAAIALYHLVFR